MEDKIYDRLGIRPGQLAEICQQWDVVELAVFGSVVRDDFGADSDVDFLYRFAPEAHPTFEVLDRFGTELEKLIERPVDLISKKAMEISSNPIRRRNILEAAQTIYVQGS